jgi:hypothetical protein
MMKLPTAILVGGLVAGALDISYAFVVYGPLSCHLSPMEWPSHGSQFDDQPCRKVKFR